MDSHPGWPNPGWSRGEDIEVRERAQDLTEQLVRGRDRFELERARKLEPDLELDDVESAIRHFDRQAELLSRHHIGFPCLETGQSLPIPAALSLDDGVEEIQSVYRQFDEIRALGKEAGVPVQPYDPERARGFLSHGLAPFLAPRLATMGAQSAPSRYRFRVETPSGPGLRVHYSAAYFFDPTKVFGSTLSTPVDGELPPGRFMFGAMAPGAKPKWNLEVTYRIPGPPDVAYVI